MGFGYHILQMGVGRDLALFEGSPINHRIYASRAAGKDVGLVCEGDELQLDSDSIDAVILHHALEFTDNPHQVLREAQRVLTPNGHLVVVGFNPWSLHAINTRIRSFSYHSLWRRQRFVSPARLSDWLHLLECELESMRRVHSLPQFGGPRLNGWLRSANSFCDAHNVPTGAVYVAHAIKRVAGSNQPRRSRYAETRRRLIGLAVPKPAGAPVPSPTPITPAARNRDTQD